MGKPTVVLKEETHEVEDWASVHDVICPSCNSRHRIKRRAWFPKADIDTPGGAQYHCGTCSRGWQVDGPDA